MAEITRERQGQMIRKVFEVLSRQAESVRARDVIAAVARELDLTPFEQSFYPNNPNVRRFEKILRFSTIPFVKAGWMLKQQGEWSLTDEGRRAYAEKSDPAAFMREAVRLYREWRTQEGNSEADVDIEDATPGASTTLEEAGESAWAEVAAHLGRLTPYDFQDLVAGLLRGMGFHIEWVAPPGPDQGVDVIALKDPLGVQRGRIKVQVKRRGDRVPVGEIRSFMAVLGEEDVGLFVALGGFTSEAEREARAQERRRIKLLSAPALFDLWVEHYASVPEAQRQLLPVRAVHFLALGE